MSKLSAYEFLKPLLGNWSRGDWSPGNWSQGDWPDSDSPAEIAAAISKIVHREFANKWNPPHAELNEAQDGFIHALRAALLAQIDDELSGSPRRQSLSAPTIERLVRLASLRAELDKHATSRDDRLLEDTGQAAHGPRMSLLSSVESPGTALDGKLRRCASLLDYVNSLGSSNTTFFPAVIGAPVISEHILRVRLIAVFDEACGLTSGIHWAPTSVWRFGSADKTQLESALCAHLNELNSAANAFVLSVNWSDPNRAPPLLVVEGLSFGLSIGLAARAASERKFIRPAVLTGVLKGSGKIGAIGSVVNKYNAAKRDCERLGVKQFFCPTTNVIASLKKEDSLEVVPVDALDDAVQLLIDGLDEFSSAIGELATPRERAAAVDAVDINDVMTQDAEGVYFKSDWDCVDHWLSMLMGDLSGNQSDKAPENVFAHVPFGNDPTAIARHVMKQLMSLRPATTNGPGLTPIPFQLNHAAAFANNEQDCVRAVHECVLSGIKRIFGIDDPSKSGRASPENQQAGANERHSSLPWLNDEFESRLEDTLRYWPNGLVFVCFESISSAGELPDLDIQATAIKTLRDYCNRLGDRAPQLAIIASGIEHANYFAQEWNADLLELETAASGKAGSK